MHKLTSVPITLYKLYYVYFNILKTLIIVHKNSFLPTSIF